MRPRPPGGGLAQGGESLEKEVYSRMEGMAGGSQEAITKEYIPLPGDPCEGPEKTGRTKEMVCYIRKVICSVLTE